MKKNWSYERKADVLDRSDEIRERKFNLWNNNIFIDIRWIFFFHDFLFVSFGISIIEVNEKNRAKNNLSILQCEQNSVIVLDRVNSPVIYT